LDGDEFASAQHARFESKRDGLWVEDVGSTNGTFVNGARVTTPRRLEQGDIVRVGQTDFRVET
jgi:pSer/pThr/pTyr-binding forkhead associated (FHA) protein